MYYQQLQKEKEFELDRHKQRIKEFSLYCEKNYLLKQGSV